MFKFAAGPPVQKGYSGNGKVTTPLPSGNAGATAVYYPAQNTTNNSGNGSGNSGSTK